MSKHKKMPPHIKIEIVNKYLAGTTTSKLVKEYSLVNRRLVTSWVKQFNEGNITLEETRGKSKGIQKGRPKAVKKREDMTKDEYIKYLEMENDILKCLAELEKKNMK